MGYVNEAMTSSLMATLLLISTCHYPPVANGIAPISANMTLDLFLFNAQLSKLTM